jgi:hypothetical protein
MSIRNLPGGVKGGRRVRFTAICKPTVQKTWDPRRLTTLWAFTACYRDSFTYLAACSFHNMIREQEGAVSDNNDHFESLQADLDVWRTMQLVRSSTTAFNYWIILVAILDIDLGRVNTPIVKHMSVYAYTCIDIVKQYCNLKKRNQRILWCGA